MRSVCYASELNAPYIFFRNELRETSSVAQHLKRDSSGLHLLRLIYKEGDW